MADDPRNLRIGVRQTPPRPSGGEERYLQVVDLGVLLNVIDRKEVACGVAGLTEAERVLLHVSSLFFEVNLGGFSGYFYNSAGNHAAEAVAALEAIGAPLTAEIVRAAGARFPSGSPPRDRDERHGQVTGLTSGSEHAFRDLDRTFDSRTGEDVDNLLEQYAELHRDSLSAEAWSTPKP